MISYCRNLEDVIIQRALGDVACGRYLDIGAFMPVEDSLTYALYERGWSGVAVDPLLDATQWRTRRPRDLAVRAMAGAVAGNRDMHVYPGALQVSTGSAAIRDHLARNGLEEPRTQSVPVVAANDLLVHFAPGSPLHLLAIDAEGMEAEVLAGLDLRRHRPWLMVIEAVLTGTRIPNHGAWEPGLLELGYQMVYFDGVNRYYLAFEQRTRLGHFMLPPNIWDGYERDSERAARARIRELEAMLAAPQHEASHAADREHDRWIST